MPATVLDAGVLIGFLDREDPHHAAATDALVSLTESRESLVLSTVTLSEVLVGPQSSGPARLAQAKHKIYDLPKMTIVPFDHHLAERTAAVRAGTQKLRMADAAVVATATAVSAARILTTDNDFRRVAGAVTLRQFNRKN